MSSTPEYGPPLDARYVLVARHVAYRDADGSVWLSRGWWKDILRHLAYVRSFRLVSPVAPLPDEIDPDLVRLEVPDWVEFDLVQLPLGIDGVAGMARKAAPCYRAIRGALDGADIVQPDNIGWPVGWIACRLGIRTRKVVVIVVENGHWRALSTAPPLRRAAGAVWEFVVRNLVSRASIVFYTQALYRESLPPGPGRPGLVVPASWVDDADVLSPDETRAAWQQKPSGRARFLFAGRFSAAKGTATLTEAIEHLRGRGVPVDIDFIGSGALQAKVESAVGAREGVNVALLEEVTYGEDFFEIVDGYHALIVPVISDEQPRIVFDGFARGVPCVASDADGIKPHVAVGASGWSFRAGDSRALADAIAEAAASIPELERRGGEARQAVAGVTHSQMHRRRREALADLLSGARG